MTGARHQGAKGVFGGMNNPCGHNLKQKFCGAIGTDAGGRDTGRERAQPMPLDKWNKNSKVGIFRNGNIQWAIRCRGVAFCLHGCLMSATP